MICTVMGGPYHMPCRTVPPHLPCKGMHSCELWQSQLLMLMLVYQCTEIIAITEIMQRSQASPPSASWFENAVMTECTQVVAISILCTLQSVVNIAGCSRFLFLQGDFGGFVLRTVLLSTLFNLLLSDSSESRDAGIELRTLALAWQSDALNILLDLRFQSV